MKAENNTAIFSLIDILCFCSLAHSIERSPFNIAYFNPKCESILLQLDVPGLRDCCLFLFLCLDILIQIQFVENLQHPTLNGSTVFSQSNMKFRHCKIFVL